MSTAATCSRRRTTRTRTGRVATFSLAFADVLLLNVWAADLGRFRAAGHGLLRTIFCASLKVFQPGEGRRTLLLFVVRDHHDRLSVESLRTVLRTDLDELWARIEDKPAAAATAPLDAFFDLNVVALPHIRYSAEEFNACVAALRAHFLASVDGAGGDGATLRRPTRVHFLASVDGADGDGGDAAAADTEPLLEAEYCKVVPAEALGTCAVRLELARRQCRACSVSSTGCVHSPAPSRPRTVR